MPVREKDGLSAIKPNLESVILAGSHEFGRAQLTEGFHVILLVALSDCVQVGGRLIAFQCATVVGVSFVGTQAQFVVTNEYMDTIVDINKSTEGVETNVVGENNLDVLDARKAVALLKLKMRQEKNGF